MINEVEQQGLAAMSLIMQTIRNADSITAPTAGASGSALTLIVPAPNNPTVFSLSSGALTVSEAGGTPAILTNNRVVVSGLTFYNLTRLGTPGMLRVEMTLKYLSTASSSPYSYQKTFYGGAALRQP